MKAIFGALICLVLTLTQAFALSGGPPYPASTNIVGTYAGVMRGLSTDPASANSVAVFSFRIPNTGLTTGTFLMFTQGRSFTGTLNGTGSPVNAVVQAILNATFNYTLHQISSSGSVTDISVTASVNGTMRASVQSSRNSSVFGTQNTLLLGNAVLNVDQGQVAPDGSPIITAVLSLKVNGFKQSSA